MLRIKDNYNPAVPSEKTKLLNEKPHLTTYGTFSLYESPFSMKQAEATAAWWLNTLKISIPSTLTSFFLKKADPYLLTQEQEKSFISILTFFILEECKKPIYQNQCFKIVYNGTHWNLVKDAMISIQFSIKNSEYIRRSIKTIMHPDEKANYIFGMQHGAIYNPENIAKHPNQKYNESGKGSQGPEFKLGKRCNI